MNQINEAFEKFELITIKKGKKYLETLLDSINLI
jgi:hypothetical protein